MPDIKHLLEIRSTPDRVYQAITTAEGIRNWWTRDAVIDPQVGANGEMGFHGKRFVAKLRVEELNPNSRVRWSVTNQAWDGKEITFALKTNGDLTVLSFTHGGFMQADDNYASANTRWGFYLLSLKRYLETGTGMPNPEDSGF